MSKLNLNAYGVTEMSYAEKVANNGGEIHLTNFWDRLYPQSFSRHRRRQQEQPLRAEIVRNGL
ncbi:MAG: hypothetical protein IKI28_03625 [Bacteroidales bacterium]|nr:hypothetical protein [Bacteroidales bacterium]